MHRSTDHSAHDATLIAAHAAGDLQGPQLLLANGLLASCQPCATLHADLRALAAATRTLPPPAAAGRDYRLTPEQAGRLHRGGLLRRLLRPFASPGSGVRPLAASMSALGAVGLAVVLLLPALGGQAAGLAPAERDTLSAIDLDATADPKAVPAENPPGGAAGVPAPSGPAAPDEGYVGRGETMTPRAQVDDVAPGDRSSAGAGGGPGPATLVLVGSSVLLAVGLALFALRFVARRIA